MLAHNLLLDHRMFTVIFRKETIYSLAYLTFLKVENKNLFFIFLFLRNILCSLVWEIVIIRIDIHLNGPIQFKILLMLSDGFFFQKEKNLQ